MPSKPELTAARLRAIKMIEAGEQMTWQKLARLARPEKPSRSWLHDTLSRLHRRGHIRVLRWIRKRQGQAMPVFVRADGKPDAPRPERLTNSQKSKRWRLKHPDRVDAAKARYAYLRKSRRPIIRSVLQNFIQSVLRPIERVQP